MIFLCIFLQADILVVPVREDLHLSGGVAEQVSLAAGAELQEECTRHVIKHGTLKVTDVRTYNKLL